MKKYGYGAILGDIAGRPYEAKYDIDMDGVTVYPEVSEITDDTIMTLGTMAAIMNDTPYALEYRYWGNRYYREYYGKSFKLWLKDSKMEFDSFGNGCIMRLSPVCLYYRNLTKIIVEAVDSLATSHEHEKSRRGVIFLSMVYDMIKKGKSKNQIKAFANECNYYIKKVEPFKDVDATVDGTLRAVMNIFISSKSTHEGILKAISLGGDTDTNASIVAEMLSTYYDDLTTDDIAYVDTHLDDFQFETLTKFNKKLSDD